MKFRWALWLFAIALTALLCFADKPGTVRACRPVLPKNYKVNLTYTGCGNRYFPVRRHIRINQGTNKTDSEYGLPTFREIGEEPYVAIYGKRNLTTKERHAIVGGVNAKPYSWPWMAALFKKFGHIKKYLCGGSLISHHYVLTAAHCFDAEKVSINASDFLVILGAYKAEDGTQYPVKKVVIHHGFKMGKVYNDIAVLRLARKVRFTFGVFPVCLPSDGIKNYIVPLESNATVTGWGDTSYGGWPSKVLQEVELTIVPLKECNEAYARFTFTKIRRGITDNLICAGVSPGGKDACTADSGGPLVMKLPGNAWVQLGIVAFGYKCALRGFPGVYTRVSSYTRWLSNNTDLV